MFFQKRKNYLKWIIKQIAKQVKDQNIQSNADQAPTVANELPGNSKSYILRIPYNEQKGEHLIRSLRKDMHCALPEKCSNENMLCWY